MSGRKRKVTIDPNWNFKIPKTREEMDNEKQRIIEEEFDGNLLRFLRRHYKQYNYEFTYSKTIPWLQKSNKGRKCVEWLFKRIDKPLHVNSVCNLVLTLVDYYDKPIERSTFRLAYRIWELFDDDELKDYHRKKYLKIVKLHKDGVIQKDIYLNKQGKKAFKEQKARGFIHINDFEDFDRRAAHVWSRYNKDYIYPENFYSCAYGKELFKVEIHIAQVCYGVRGWTTIKYPKN